MALTLSKKSKNIVLSGNSDYSNIPLSKWDLDMFAELLRDYSFDKNNKRHLQLYYVGMSDAEAIKQYVISIIKLGYKFNVRGYFDNFDKSFDEMTDAEIDSELNKLYDNSQSLKGKYKKQFDAILGEAASAIDNDRIVTSLFMELFPDDYDKKTKSIILDVPYKTNPNDNYYYKKYKTWGASAYDIWVQIQKNSGLAVSESRYVLSLDSFINLTN